MGYQESELTKARRRVSQLWAHATLAQIKYEEAAAELAELEAAEEDK